MSSIGDEVFLYHASAGVSRLGRSVTEWDLHMSGRDMRLCKYIKLYRGTGEQTFLLSVRHSHMAFAALP